MTVPVLGAPENEVFRVVFPPDRIFHARHLTATRSGRYAYRVTDVRSAPDVTVLKATVRLSGVPAANLLRLEYGGRRLQEAARTVGRRLGTTVLAHLGFPGHDVPPLTVTLHWDPLITGYAVELWNTLEPPPGLRHDHRVAAVTGRRAAITRAGELDGVLADLAALRQVEVWFSEEPREPFTGRLLPDPQTDVAYLRNRQEPRSPVPSSPENTVEDHVYRVDFQRGFFIPDAHAVEPVRYRNAMMDQQNPERADDNVLEMRWLLQRELGGELVFFHQVTIPPGVVEGTHQHVGSEEVYYVVSGTGTAYLGSGDDPTTDGYPEVSRDLFGLDAHPCRELPVRPGSVIATKSGGIHGIRNTSSDVPLVFVAFLHQTT